MAENKKEAQVAQVATTARPHLEAFDAERMKAQGKTPGWRTGNKSDPPGTIWINESYGAVMAVMVVKPDGTICNDAILATEKGGTNIVVIDDFGRIGVQLQWRFQTNDIEKWQANWPKRINVLELGRPSYELPRGYGIPGIPTSKLAAIRLMEKTGEELVWQFELEGPLCDNGAHKPHLTKGIVARVRKHQSGQVPENAETWISKLEFKTEAELADLARNQLFYCGISMSTIYLAKLLHPEFFQAA